MHMITIMQDKGLSDTRGPLLYFRTIATRMDSLPDGGLCLERGGRRTKALWLLAMMLQDRGIAATDPEMEPYKFLFNNIRVRNVGQKSATDRRIAVLNECANDTAFTKMSTIEAYFTIVVPDAHENNPDPSNEPSMADMIAAWRRDCIEFPKVQRAVFYTRDVEAFVNRTTPDLKGFLWREHLEKGNDARASSSIYKPQPPL